MSASSLIPLTREAILEAVNRFQEDGGPRIKWSEEVQGYITAEGDRYTPGDIEDIARGIIRDAGQCDGG